MRMKKLNVYFVNILLLICIVLCITACVLVWKYKPIYFEGAPKNINITRNDEFKCLLDNIPKNKGGGRVIYSVSTKIVPFLKREEMYMLFKTFKPTQYKDKGDYSKFPYISADFEQDNLSVHIESYNDGYIWIKQRWRYSQYASWQDGEKYYYECDKILLESLINDFIAISEKEFPEVFGSDSSQ